MQPQKNIITFFLFFASITSFSQDAKTLTKNGFEKINNKNFIGAEKDFSDAIKLNEAEVNKYLDKMKKYSAMSPFEIATSDMPDGFVYNNDYAVPYYGRGLAYESQSKQTEAATDYEKAILIDPKYAEANCQYGLILINKGIKDQGCICLQKAKSKKYEKAISSYSSNNCNDMAVAFLNSGKIKLDAKDYKNAIEDFTNGIKLNNEIDQLYIKRAECYKALKQIDKAINDYNKALKSTKDSSTVYTLRGIALNAQQNFQLAFEDFTAAIKFNPNAYDAFLNRGTSCEGLNNLASAEYDYSQAIRIKPEEGLAYYKRGLVTQEMKNGNPCKDFKTAVAKGCEDAQASLDGCQ